MADNFDTAAIARGLEAASDEMKREIAVLIPRAADRMASTIRQRYPLGRKNHPGRPHMREDISIRNLGPQNHFLPGRKVKGPTLAYIWQNGSVDRYDETRGNAYRGRMPKAAPDFFERTAASVRSDMMRNAQAILDRNRQINTVSGGPGGGGLL